MAIAEDEDASWKEHMDAGEAADKQSHFEESYAQFSLARKAATTFKRPDPRLAESLFRQAQMSEVLGKSRESERLFKRSLLLREQIFGMNHPDVARTLHSLAAIYSQQCKYAKSEELYKRSMEIRQKILGAHDREVYEDILGLADLYRRQGREAEAEKLYKQSTVAGMGD